jgi:hypothetical protein
MVAAILLLAQLAGSTSLGAAGPYSGPFQSNGPATIAHKPLVCPQYQHEHYQPSYVGGPPCESGSCLAVAITYPEVDECVDDMHEVTEREWQQMKKDFDALLDLVELINVTTPIVRADGTISIGPTGTTAAPGEQTEPSKK